MQSLSFISFLFYIRRRKVKQIHYHSTKWSVSPSRHQCVVHNIAKLCERLLARCFFFLPGPLRALLVLLRSIFPFPVTIWNETQALPDYLMRSRLFMMLCSSSNLLPLLTNHGFDESLTKDTTRQLKPTVPNRLLNRPLTGANSHQRNFGISDSFFR